jgi:hypothetical protein
MQTSRGSQGHKFHRSVVFLFKERCKVGLTELGYLAEVIYKLPCNPAIDQ